MSSYAIDVILRGVVLASADDEESATQLAIDHANKVLKERSPFVEYEISPLQGLAKDVATAVKEIR